MPFIHPPYAQSSLTRRIALLLVIAWSGSAYAADVPALKSGTWQLRKLVNQRPYDMRKCMDPYRDLIQQHADRQESGCSFVAKQTAPLVWQIDSKCKKVSREGRRWESDSISVMTVESETAYKLNVKGSTNGVPLQESVDARWIGPCTN